VNIGRHLKICRAPPDRTALRITDQVRVDEESQARISMAQLRLATETEHTDSTSMLCSNHDPITLYCLYRLEFLCVCNAAKIQGL
jgi:hypothetical protein